MRKHTLVENFRAEMKDKNAQFLMYIRQSCRAIETKVSRVAFQHFVFCPIFIAKRQTEFSSDFFHMNYCYTYPLHGYPQWIDRICFQ